MSAKVLRLFWLLAAALLASCSGVRALERHAGAQRTQFNDYAGKPVEQFTWVTANRSSWAIDRNQLVAWTNINQAYLVTVASPCPNLRFANRIGISSTAGTVYARFDRVFAQGRTCLIKTIQPVDYRRMQRDLARHKLAG
ncbi:MAG: hypothetical protein HIU85_18210 [Proteobacteria bacterium]|nr:hypothetical protein [Pseudomonadota bacterium]